MTLADLDRILVIGGSGQIGQDLITELRSRGHDTTGTYHDNAHPGLVRLDAFDKSEVDTVMGSINPGTVVNCLNAPGGTDACELDPELAQRSHFEGGKHLADAAYKVGAKFIQISSDYVFDGNNGPYVETDEAIPLSKLGQAKLALENYILTRISRALVVRTSFVFSWTPKSKTKNFVMQILDAGQSGTSITVPTDQVGNVTYSPNFAEALTELIEQRKDGLYHLSGTTRCSKHEWALITAAFFHVDQSLITGVTTQELAQAGPRPLESGFVLDKAMGDLSRTHLLTLNEGLRDMSQRMGMNIQL